MANPSLQIGNSNWAIKEDNLLGYSTAGTRFVPQPITMTRESAGTRVNSSGLVETVELLGGEEIATPDFSSSTGWSFTNSGGSNGWIIDAGRAICDSSAVSPYRNLNSTFSLVNGKSYRLIIDILQSADNMKIYIGGSLLAETLPTGTNLNYEYFIPESAHSGGVFTIYAGSSDLQEIDNVSLKESTKNNLARVDYDGTASSLLVEPERTNLLPYSEDFSDSSWNKFRSSLSINQTTSPDGTVNADLIEQDYPTTSVHGGLNNPTDVTAGDEYTYSFFVKKKEYSWIELAEAATSAGNVSTWFDVENGVVGNIGAGSTAQIEDFGNGWYRCSISFTSAYTGNKNLVLYLSKANGSSVADIVGGVYIWGAQAEEGSYATSYIPTDGSTVTRVQDQYSKTGISDLINSTEGVLFVEMAALSDDLTRRRITLSDGTTNNRVNLYFENQSNKISVYISGSGGSDSMSYTVSDTTQFHKIAVSYKDGDSSLWIDGFERDTSATSFNLANLSVLDFSQAGGSEPLYGKVKQLQVYKTALTDTQLAALTS